VRSLAKDVPEEDDDGDVGLGEKPAEVLRRSVARLADRIAPGARSGGQELLTEMLVQRRITGDFEL